MFDKRFNCTPVEGWHTGVFFRLESMRKGGIRLVACDSKGNLLPGGNLLALATSSSSPNKLQMLRYSGVKPKIADALDFDLTENGRIKLGHGETEPDIERYDEEEDEEFDEDEGRDIDDFDFGAAAQDEARADFIRRAQEMFQVEQGRDGLILRRDARDDREFIAPRLLQEAGQREVQRRIIDQLAMMPGVNNAVRVDQLLRPPINFGEMPNPDPFEGEREE